VADPTLVAPDTVGLVIGWLSGLMTEPVSSSVPNPRPDAFLVVKNLGGPGRSVISDRPTISVEAWSDTARNALLLAQQARGHLWDMASRVIGSQTVYSVTDIGSPGDLPDPDSAQPRATFTVEVRLRLATA
jgi:hypothetical protein